MRTGADHDKLPPHVPSFENDLLQVMPWLVYRGMIDRDLRAIYQYLRAIPPREGGRRSSRGGYSSAKRSRPVSGTVLPRRRQAARSTPTSRRRARPRVHGPRANAAPPERTTIARVPSPLHASAASASAAPLPSADGVSVQPRRSHGSGSGRSSSSADHVVPQRDRADLDERRDWPPRQPERIGRGQGVVGRRRLGMERVDRRPSRVSERRQLDGRSGLHGDRERRTRRLDRLLRRGQPLRRAVGVAGEPRPSGCGILQGQTRPAKLSSRSGKPR